MGRLTSLLRRTARSAQRALRELSETAERIAEGAGSRPARATKPAWEPAYSRYRHSRPWEIPHQRGRRFYCHLFSPRFRGKRRMHTSRCRMGGVGHYRPCWGPFTANTAVMARPRACYSILGAVITSLSRNWSYFTRSCDQYPRLRLGRDTVFLFRPQVRAPTEAWKLVQQACYAGPIQDRMEIRRRLGNLTSFQLPRNQGRILPAFSPTSLIPALAESLSRLQLPSSPNTEPLDVGVDLAVGAAVDFDLSPRLAVPLVSELTEDLVSNLGSALRTQIGELTQIWADVQRLAELGELPVSLEREGSTVRVHFPNCTAEEVSSLLHDKNVTRGRIVEIPAIIPNNVDTMENVPSLSTVSQSPQSSVDSPWSLSSWSELLGVPSLSPSSNSGSSYDELVTVA